MALSPIRRAYKKIDGGTAAGNFQLVAAPGAGKRLVIRAIQQVSGDNLDNNIDFKFDNTEFHIGAVGPGEAWYLREDDEPIPAPENEKLQVKTWDTTAKDVVFNVAYQVEQWKQP